MKHIIITELSNHEYLKKRLEADFPDIDDETLSDTLEGLTNLNEQLAAVVRSQQEDRVFSSALKERIQEMQDRLKRFEHRVSRKRDLVASVMERADIKKLTEDDFTASLRSTPPQLVLSDEDVIPENFWKVQSPKLDRQLLIAHLKSGQAVEGASLGNGGMTVSVRVK